MADLRDRFFDDAEYARRLAKVRHRMVRAGIDLFVTTNPSNVCYLAGHFTQAINDPMFLAVPLEGKPLLQLPPFELPRFEASGVGADAVSTWCFDDEPAPPVVRELVRRDWVKGRVAIDAGPSFTSLGTIAVLKEGLNAELVSDLVESVRLTKSPAEQSCLREAGRMTDAGVAAALAAYGEGVSDNEVAAAALEAMVRAGSEPTVCDPYVCVGWRTGVPHSNRGGTVARAGDPVFVELGGTRARYTAPMMRCAVLGEPNAEIRELAETSFKAHTALLGVIRAGVKVSEVSAVGYAAVEPLLDRIVFHYSYGYAVGLSFPPTWADCPHFPIHAENTATLEAGMVFHVPVMLRFQGRYGVGCSETVIVTEDGVETLSRLPRQLLVK
jgi:Xaa-Pro aminopeptidase